MGLPLVHARGGLALPARNACCYAVQYLGAVRCGSCGSSDAWHGIVCTRVLLRRGRPHALNIVPSWRLSLPPTHRAARPHGRASGRVRGKSIQVRVCVCMCVCVCVCVCANEELCLVRQSWLSLNGSHLLRTPVLCIGLQTCPVTTPPRAHHTATRVSAAYMHLTTCSLPPLSPLLSLRDWAEYSTRWAYGASSRPTYLRYALVTPRHLLFVCVNVCLGGRVVGMTARLSRVL